MEITDGRNENEKKINIKQIVLTAIMVVVAMVVGFALAKYNVFGAPAAEAYHKGSEIMETVENSVANEASKRVVEAASIQSKTAGEAVMDSVNSAAASKEEIPHQHTYENGICIDCGYECPHELHSQDLICNECGAFVYHTYSSGHSCEICGYRLYDSYDSLPDEYFEEIREKGSVEAFVVGGKNLYVYTPYGYDPDDQDTKYDVLILAHGSGGTGRGVIEAATHIKDQKISITELLDHMIANHDSRPMIVITFDFGGNYMPPLMLDYIHDSIFPFVIENYHTYANSFEDEDIIAARSHFAMGGFSLGSMYTMNCGMTLALPYFGNFLCFAGENGTEELIYALNNTFKDYPIDYWCVCSGDGDGETAKVKMSYASILGRVGRLENHQNAHLCITAGNHEWKPWFVGMYNGFRLLFQREVTPNAH